MSIRLSSVIVMAALMVCVSLSYSGEIYKWIDESGGVHFSDKPVDERAAKIDQKRLPELNFTPDPDELLPPAAPTSSFLSGNITLKGGLYHDGKPLSELTTIKPDIRVWSYKLNEWFTPSFDYFPASGSFALYNLPTGKFSASFRVDADVSNPSNYPGDLKGSLQFVASEKNPVPLIVDMERIIHLLKPQDNNSPLTGWGLPCEEKVPYTSPVLFSWEPLGADAIYTYTITRTECQPFTWKETIAGDTIRETQVLLNLPPNRPGEHYMLRLTARKNGKEVGSLMTHGSNGFGWDYRFRIVR